MLNITAVNMRNLLYLCSNAILSGFRIGSAMSEEPLIPY